MTGCETCHRLRNSSIFCDLNQSCQSKIMSHLKMLKTKFEEFIDDKLFDIFKCRAKKKVASFSTDVCLGMDYPLNQNIRSNYNRYVNISIYFSCEL